MSDDPAYILDVEGVDEPPPDDDQSPRRPRRWIGMRFECCSVYNRIYRNRQGTAYVGHCPRCSRIVRVPIGPGGTTHRMFRAH